VNAADANRRATLLDERERLEESARRSVSRSR